MYGILEYAHETVQRSELSDGEVQTETAATGPASISEVQYVRIHGDSAEKRTLEPEDKVEWGDGVDVTEDGEKTSIGVVYFHEAFDDEVDGASVGVVWLNVQTEEWWVEPKGTVEEAGW